MRHIALHGVDTLKGLEKKRNGIRVHKCMRVQSLRPVHLFATSGPVACQAPLYMGFSRQVPWSGLPFPPPGDPPKPEIKPPASLAG